MNDIEINFILKNHINKDFNKLLKTETYPEIKLHLKEINKTNKKENTVTAKVEIFIAGKTQSYTLPVTIKDEGFTKKKSFKYNAVNFIFDEGSSARVTCRDYKKKYKKKIDQLGVILNSIEFRKWLNEEAYK